MTSRGSGLLVGVDASRVTRRLLTGTENYSLQVLRHLLSLDEQNRYRLYLSETPAQGLLPLSSRTEQQVIRMPRLWTHGGLSREMLRHPPDVLYVPSHVLPLVCPQPSVVLVYDVGHRFFPRAHRATEWLYVEWAIRRHVRIASAIITISEAARQDLIRLYGAHPERVAVAYPAVDEHFAPVGAHMVKAVRARYDLPSRYVLHVGTIKPRKNLPRLIEAFARIAREVPDVALVLAGAAENGTLAVKHAIERHGLERRVQLLTYVDGADLPGLYTGAACTVVVSLHEGFGMPALEALACGAPTVVSNRGALPEVVGDAALLVDPLNVDSIAAALHSVLQDSALQYVLRVLGPRRARHFSWHDAATVTLDVINRVGH